MKVKLFVIKFSDPSSVDGFARHVYTAESTAKAEWKQMQKRIDKGKQDGTAVLLRQVVVGPTGPAACVMVAAVMHSALMPAKIADKVTRIVHLWDGSTWVKA